MSYVVSALTVEEKFAMMGFLFERGVRLKPSEDFQAFGSVSSESEFLQGVVAFTGFCGRTCTMHTAGDGNWVTRRLIWQSFDYPFRRCNLEAVFAPVAADNERALKFDQKLGFCEVHRVVNGWDDGVDLIFLQLLRRDCFWLAKLDARFAH